MWALMLSALLMFFFFNDTATTEIYTLSLHDALPICEAATILSSSEAKSLSGLAPLRPGELAVVITSLSPLANPLLVRSEEHTSELQSQSNLVCRLLLEKKKSTTAISCMRSAQVLFPS